MIISFILDGILSKYLVNLFLPLLTITYLVLIYPYTRSKKNYIILCIITGLLYDITYTDVFLQNVISFVLIGLLVIILNKYFMNNILNSLINIILAIIFYRTFTYLCYLLFSNNAFNIMLLFKSIYTSLITNIIYGIFVYFILDFIGFKYKIKKIN